MAMDLTTRCPKCGTVFSATLAQLQLRKGYIRCISCANIFDGYEAVVPSDDPVFQEEVAPPRFEPASRLPATGTGHPPVSSPITRPAFEPQVVRPRSGPESAAVSMAATQAAGLQMAPEPVEPARVTSPERTALPLSPVPPVVHVPVLPEPPEPPEPFNEPEAPAFTVPVASVPPRTLHNEPRAPFTVSSRPTLAEHAEPRFRVGSSGAPASDTRFSVGDTSQMRAAPEPIRATDFPAPDPAPALYVEPRRDRASPGSGGRSSKPDFIASPSSTVSALMGVFWGGLLMLALVVLAVQVAYVYRAQLANNFPELRPSLESLCVQAGCTVPYSREIRQIVVVSSALRAPAATANGKGVVTEAQSAADAGRVVLDFVMRNTYDKPQEWPTLVLTLTDFSGALIARKNLPPAAYLPPALRDQPFAAGAQINAQLPLVVNAGVRINGYQIDKFFQ